MAVCRDHAKDACKRQQCKYYHIPIAVPPAHVMANLFKRDITPTTTITTQIAAAAAAQTTTVQSASRAAIAAAAAAAATMVATPITQFTTADGIMSNRSIEMHINHNNNNNHINQTTGINNNNNTIFTSVIETSLSERQCPSIRSHRSTTQTHL